MTKEEKEIWNKAIIAACLELLKWDGLIPHKFDREMMSSEIIKRLSKKIKNTNTNK